jgi:protein-L-isoaspartate(D-aspartate) O-methyltransferase
MGAMKPMTEQHLAILRRHMVELVDLHFDLAEEEIGKSALEPRLRNALLHVPRHIFVPGQLAAVAYQDSPLPIGFDKTLSQPFIGALMLDLLELEPRQRVLEIGTGLGYQAAVMAELGAEVFTVEIVEEFAEAAGIRIATLGLDAQSRPATARAAGRTMDRTTRSWSPPLRATSRTHCPSSWRPAARW